ncbi:MAG: NUDIX hydrolase [Dysgonomonas sp.]
MGKDKPICEPSGSDQDKYVPGVTISCVAFSFESGSLKLLLCRPKGETEWILPGGPIAQDEDADQAARRILKNKIGVKRPFMNQFHFFGEKDRTDVAGIQEGDEPSYPRLINLAYYSLVKNEEIKQVGSNEDEIRWFHIGERSCIHVDHQEIIDTCIFTIRRQVGFLPIGYGLLPEKFTMPELRVIYETILERSIDRRNFQRKILSIGYVKPLYETRKIGGHKSPNLYKFDKRKCEEAVRLGIQLMSNNL